jgi:hypothetical protein
MGDKTKAFKIDGQGKSRAITAATTPEKAREAVQASRQRLPRGSSTSYEVREPKRK